MSRVTPEINEQLTLCEALDRVLNKGAVVVGEITISVANVDLIYLGLQLVLTSTDNLPDRPLAVRAGAGAGLHLGTPGEPTHD